MNYFKLNEKMLKHNLKNRRSITLSLIVAYLITGEIGEFLDFEILARDLRPRKNNVINVAPGQNGLNTSKSENGKDVVNIVKPNQGGISHNKFIDLSVGTDGLIFNNNATDTGYSSSLGGIVSFNPNLKGGNAANAILNEVTGSQTTIGGMVEVAGTKADFIVANENGITINGGGFINTSGVTLTTGRPTVNNSTINFDVTKGNITVGEGGVGTSGDYFNLISQTIDLQGQIAKAQYEGNNTDPNITLLAGQNRATVKNGQVTSYERIGNEKASADQKYGITATGLGSMYGQNIRLISTTEGVGVRHEGIVSSSKDISINSAGDIEVGHLYADKTINIEAGNDFKTIDGTHKVENRDEQNTIGATDVSIKADNKVELNTDVQAKQTMNVTGKDVVNKGVLKAGENEGAGNLKINAGNLINDSVITSGKDLEITAENVTNQADATVVATGNIQVTTDKNLLNKGILSAGKDMSLKAETLDNEGKITSGDMLNISAETLNSVLASEEALKEFAQIADKYSPQAFDKATDEKKRLEELLKTETNPVKRAELQGKIQEQQKIIEEQNGYKAKIMAIKDLSYITTKGLNVDGKTINIGALSSVGESGTIKGENVNLENMTVIGDLSVTGNNFTGTGLNIGQDFSANIDEFFKTLQNFEVGKNATINAGSVDMSGETKTGEGLEINASGIVFDGKVTVGSDLTINRDGKLQDVDITNKSNLGISGTTNINANKLDNQNSINSTGGLVLNVDSVANKEGATLGGRGDINIKGTTFDNAGKITAGSNFEIEGKNVGNSGEVNAVGTFDVILNDGLFTNSGYIEGVGGVTLTGSGTAQNEKDGELKSGTKIDVTGKDMVFYNKGKLTSASGITIDIKDLFSDGNMTAIGDIDIIVEQFLQNKSAQLVGETIDITANKVQVAGTVGAQNTTGINIVGKNEVLLNGAKFTSNKTDIDSDTGITIDKRNQFFGKAEIEAKEDLVNKGMLLARDNLLIVAKNIINEVATTIYSNADLVLEATEKIWNKLKASIIAQGSMTLTAESLTNDAGTIQAKKDITINANTVENRSRVEGEGYKVTGEQYVGKAEGWSWKAGFDMYHKVEIWLPKIEVDLRVEDKATIVTQGNLTINGKDGKGSKSKVTNTAGMMSGNGNVIITGDLRNETGYTEMTVEKYLSLVKVKLSWETKTLGAGLHLNGGTNYEGSLLGAMSTAGNRLGDDNCKGYTKALKQLADKNPELKRVLNVVLGPDWMTYNVVPVGKMDVSSKIPFYATNGNAQIAAGKNFNHSGGVLENLGGETNSGKTTDITIGGHTVEGSVADLDIKFKNPNEVLETDSIKIVNKPEIQTGVVTIIIDGEEVKIDSSMGTGGSIAAAGTISSIIFIDIPQGNSGIFIKNEPDPNKNINHLFGDNVGFMDQDDYINSGKFFEDMGYNPDKPTTVIGDSAYQKQLIEKTIQQGLNYTGSVSYDNMREMLNAATEAQKELGLEVGKPLTAEQINNLEKDIIWYVEMEVEVDGEKHTVLVPQVYFGKESRVKIANSGKYDVATGSIIKAEGNVTIDATNVVNSTGSITAGTGAGGGSVIIVSEKDIINNSNANVPGGIQASNGGHVALNAKNDIIMKGGNVKADVVIVDAGNDIEIVSGVTSDEDGDQVIKNAAGIIAESGMVINAGNDFTMKGGVLQANGHHVEEPVSEETVSDSTDGVETENKAETKEPEVVKDVDYYKNLIFKAGKKGPTDTEKDGAELLEELGAKAGEVNITAKGNVNIGDLNLVQSSATGDIKEMIKQEKEQNNGVAREDWTSGYTETVTSVSTGSVLKGESIVIKSDKNVTIQGSNLISENNEDKSKASNGISIEAGENVEILDGKDLTQVYEEKIMNQVIGYEKETTEIKGAFSKGSNIVSMGDIDIKANKGNVKVVGSNLASLGDVSMDAAGDIKFEAGKNEVEQHYEKYTSGIVSSSAEAGLSGQYGENFKNVVAGGKGKLQQDDLARTEVTIGTSHFSQHDKSTTWTESNLSGNNISINAGNTADIGGVNMTASENLAIKAKKVETSKYVDEHESETKESSTGLKLWAAGQSAAASWGNLGIEAANRAENAVGAVGDQIGLVGAQVVGAAMNTVLGDAITGSAGVSFVQTNNWSKTKTSEENTIELTAKNISITATESDINLAGVKMKAGHTTGNKVKDKDGNEVDEWVNDGSISLDAAKDINITAAKKTEESSFTSNSFELGVNGYAGVGLTGGGVSVGASVNNSYAWGDSSSLTHTNSEIVGGNIALKSGGDTNIKGGNVNGDNVNLDIGGSLNIETVKDKKTSTSKDVNFGASVSVGVDTMGPVGGGVNVGYGNTWEDSELIGQQSGIIANGSLNGTVKGDMNLTGGAIGSTKGEGSLAVGGKVNVKDVVANEKTGGGSGGVSVGGGAGGANLGIYGSVADQLDRDTTAKATIGGITITGTDGSIKDLPSGVNTDLENSLTTDTHKKMKGGNFGFGAPVTKKGVTGTAANIKNNAKKVTTKDGWKQTGQQFKNLGSKDYYKEVGQGIKGGFKKAGHDIASTPGKVKDITVKAAEGIKDGAVAVGGAIKSGASSFKDKIQNGVGNLKDKLHKNNSSSDNMEISSPTNVKHVGHVGTDGGFGEVNNMVNGNNSVSSKPTSGADSDVPAPNKPVSDTTDGKKVTIDTSKNVKIEYDSNEPVRGNITTSGAEYNPSASKSNENYVGDSYNEGYGSYYPSASKSNENYVGDSYYDGGKIPTYGDSEYYASGSYKEYLDRYYPNKSNGTSSDGFTNGFIGENYNGDLDSSLLNGYLAPIPNRGSDFVDGGIYYRPSDGVSNNKPAYIIYDKDGNEYYLSGATFDPYTKELIDAQYYPTGHKRPQNTGSDYITPSKPTYDDSYETSRPNKPVDTDSDDSAVRPNRPVDDDSDTVVRPDDDRENDDEEDIDPIRRPNRPIHNRPAKNQAPEIPKRPVVKPTVSGGYLDVDQELGEVYDEIDKNKKPTVDPGDNDFSGSLEGGQGKPNLPAPGGEKAVNGDVASAKAKELSGEKKEQIKDELTSFFSSLKAKFQNKDKTKDTK